MNCVIFDMSPDGDAVERELQPAQDGRRVTLGWLALESHAPMQLRRERRIISIAWGIIATLVLLAVVLLWPGEAQAKAENYKYTASDIKLMARVVYAESRGEPKAGQIAVVAVILNRHRLSGGSLKHIVTAPHQFSVGPNINEKGKSRAAKQMKACIAVVKEVLSKKLLPLPAGTIYFKTTSGRWRGWNKQPYLYCKIGHHYFFTKAKAVSWHRTPQKFTRAGKLVRA